MSDIEQRRKLGVWLLLCALTVYLMIIVGGVTRLTQSGLSMVEWEPIMGVIPPITEVDWQAVFKKYQAFPEYQKINYGMSLQEFKSIFWWEYGHRVLGRLIGLIFLIPFLFFLFKGYIKGAWRWKLGGLFLLGGLQGLMGWYMVKSGLVDVPHVSQYRLVAHFSLALIIYGLMIWYMFDFFRTERLRKRPDVVLLKLSTILLIVIFIMLMSGGFVAGTRAGFIFNTFPLMDGQWVPNGLWVMSPWWQNLFENVVTIQFVHRLIAVLVTLAVLTLLVKVYKQQGSIIHYGSHYLLLVLLVQLCLGVITLVNVVPVGWAAGHQAGAVALFTAALYVSHKIRKAID